MIIISPILLEGEKWERVKDIAKGQLKGAEKGASVGGGIGLGVGAANVASSMLGSKKSREFEKEADLISVKYLENAGIDKVSFGLALQKLVSNSCRPTSEISLQECLEKDGSGWLSSHPSGAERLKILSLQ